MIRSSLAGYKSNTEQLAQAIWTIKKVSLAGYKIQVRYRTICTSNLNNKEHSSLIQKQYRTIPDSCEPYNTIQSLQGMTQIDPKPSLELDTSGWMRCWKVHTFLPKRDQGTVEKVLQLGLGDQLGVIGKVVLFGLAFENCYLAQTQTNVLPSHLGIPGYHFQSWQMHFPHRIASATNILGTIECAMSISRSRLKRLHQSVANVLLHSNLVVQIV